MGEEKEPLVFLCPRCKDVDSRVIRDGYATLELIYGLDGNFIESGDPCVGEDPVDDYMVCDNPRCGFEAPVEDFSEAARLHNEENHKPKPGEVSDTGQEQATFLSEG